MKSKRSVSLDPREVLLPLNHFKFCSMYIELLGSYIRSKRLGEFDAIQCFVHRS